jgi:hypothetical protein
MFLSLSLSSGMRMLIWWFAAVLAFSKVAFQIIFASSVSSLASATTFAPSSLLSTFLICS